MLRKNVFKLYNELQSIVLNVKSYELILLYIFMKINHVSLIFYVIKNKFFV